MLDFLDIPGGFGIEEISAPRGWWKRTIGELDLPTRRGLQILLLKSGDKFIASPGPELEVHEGDIMVIFGHDRRLAQLKK
jgi:trk system potassium uptake protein TrkA